MPNKKNNLAEFHFGFYSIEWGKSSLASLTRAILIDNGIYTGETIWTDQAQLQNVTWHEETPKTFMVTMTTHYTFSLLIMTKKLKFLIVIIN